MTPKFKVASKYLLSCRKEVPLTSMRKVATHAGVKPATLVRLAQSLGYRGWDDLKSVFVQSLRQTPKGYADQARKLIGAKNPRDALDRAFATQADNVRLLAHTNAQRLPWAVQLLSKAKQVHVRSEEHTSELQSLISISYAVFSL